MGKYSSRIKDWPEDDRPRERLVKLGAEKLSNTEILAILLRVGNHKNTAIELARELIRQFGGLRGLDSRSAPELCELNGIGIAKAAQIKAAFELGKRLCQEGAGDKQKVESSEDVYRLVSPHLANRSREVFRVLMLTSRNTLIADKVLFEGSLTDSIVSPREIIKEAINCSAASLVFVHNHPSGNPNPSHEDRTVTKRLKDACEAVGVHVLDHIIVGDTGYYSFADEGSL